MNRTGKISKTEWVLLAITAVFLCILLVLFQHDRKAAVSGITETEITEPQEEVLPDVSPLDLNAATVEELTQLPGIGEELARRIVAYRTEHGYFVTVEELTEVSGIGEGKLKELDGRVTVSREEAE